MGFKLTSQSYIYNPNDACLKSGFIIYGCYGYTGQLICHLAVAKGLKPVIAGRNEVRVKELAQKLGLDYRVFDAEDIESVKEQIKDFKILLNCAGPFVHTAPLMAQACLKTQTHYLDITGEYQVFEHMFSLDKEAIEAKVMLMSGVGFDVVPTDCLSLYLKESLAGATSLELALYTQGGKLSHGTAITVTENLGEPTKIRKAGKLISVPNGQITKEITIEGKTLTGVAISWGDISTAYRTTRIPDITVFNILPEKLIRSMRMSNYIGFLLRTRLVKNYLIDRIRKRPAGPDENQRKQATTVVWGKVKNAMGGQREAVLSLPEGYTLTAETAVEIVKRILAKEPTYGARTPAKEFGKDFIMQFEGVSRKDIAFAGL